MSVNATSAPRLVALAALLVALVLCVVLPTGGGGEDLVLRFDNATTSNDTSSGSVHRQPYTRPSTYAAPGGIRSVETRGVLDAFDCSHLGDPVEQPPIGPFPPCHEQAPITFQGLTAQFPHVNEAP